MVRHPISTAIPLAWGLALALGMLVPAAAMAGDGIHPRTPAIWEKPDAPGQLDPPPCMTVVNRSQDPVLHVDYSIPFEDTEVTEDEVADSRTHQFIALRQTGRPLGDVTPLECPEQNPQVLMPSWIASADVRAASALGRVLDPAGPWHRTPDPTDCCTVDTNEVLAIGDIWVNCWDRITADDDRRPITWTAAAQGMDWNTSGLPVGAYAIYGYTWEPYFSLWSKRPGVVKVVDDPDPANSPPAAALRLPAGEDDVYMQDESPVLDLCVDAESGSTVTLSWAVAEQDPTFVALVSDVAAVNGDNALQFDVPPDTPGGTYLLRADVTDPSNRTLTAYIDRAVSVLAAVNDPPDDERVPSRAPESWAEPEPKESNGCRIGGAPAGLGGLLVGVVGAIGWRRRR